MAVGRSRSAPASVPFSSVSRPPARRISRPFSVNACCSDPATDIASLTRKIRPGPVFAAIAALVLTATVSLLLPLAVRRVVDGFETESVALLDQYFVAALAIAGLLALGTGLRYYLVTRLGERVVADIRKAVFSRMIHMSPAFFERIMTGEVLSRITTDTTLLLSVIGSSVSVALRNVLLFLGGLGMMLYTSPKLTGLVLLIVPVVIVPIVLLGRRLRMLSRQNQDWIAESSGKASEALLSAQAVQAFTNERATAGQFDDVTELSFESAKTRIRTRAIMTVIVIALVFAGVVGVLWIGARDVRAEACRGAVALHAGVGHGAFVEGVVPKLARCIADESHVVRNAYAESCSDIILALDEGDRSASSGGAGVNNLVVNTFTLLTDDNPEVRAKVMGAIQRLTARSAAAAAAAGASPENNNNNNGLLEERFLTSLKEGVAHDPDWRVRASFTVQLPALAKALGQAMFQQHFYDAYKTLLVDEVAAVRAATVEIVVALADELEESWLHKILVPTLLEMIGGSGSSSRNADG